MGAVDVERYLGDWGSLIKIKSRLDWECPGGYVPFLLRYDRFAEEGRRAWCFVW
jgi:hypothetical protein